MRAKLWNGCTINEALSRSSNALRTMVHSSIKETTFQRNYGRKPRRKLTNYLNLSPNVKTKVFSVKPETLQFYTFANNEGHHTQLVMKALRKLKEDVNNKFSYLILEKKVN